MTTQRTDTEIMRDFFDTVHYDVVQSWRDVPELGTSEDEPEDEESEPVGARSQTAPERLQSQSGIIILRFNPHHDKAGRFASASGAGAVNPSAVSPTAGSKPAHGSKYTSIDQVSVGDKVAWGYGTPNVYYGTVTAKHKHNANIYAVKDENGATHYPSYKSLTYTGQAGAGAPPKPAAKPVAKPAEAETAVAKPTVMSAPAAAAMLGGDYVGGVWAPYVESVKQSSLKPFPKYMETSLEAQKFAQETYPHITWKLDKMHDEAAVDVAREFHALARDFPEPVAGLSFVGLANYAKGKDSTDVWAFAGGYRMGFEPYFFQKGHPNGQPWISTLSSMQKSTIPKGAGSAFHPPNTGSVKGVLDHEFGHVVHSWVHKSTADHIIPGLSAAHPNGFGSVKSTVSMFDDNSKGLASVVSQYAKSNHKETFAEGFAYMRNNPVTAKSPVYVQRQQAFLKALGNDSRAWTYHKPGTMKWADQLPSSERKEALDRIAKMSKDVLGK